jgi:hypothetical protein
VSARRKVVAYEPEFYLQFRAIVVVTTIAVVPGSADAVA